MMAMEYKPLKDLRYYDTFQDEFGNTYTVTDHEDENGVELTFEAPSFSRENKLPRFIGKITAEGVYLKYEKEIDRYQKENAWTINHAVLKRAERVEYYTDSRLYSIDAQKALRLGKKLVLRDEEKIVVPVRYWEVTSDNRLENRRLQLLGVEWTDKLADEMDLNYMKGLAAKINAARKTGPVYPSNDDMFRALKLTQYSDVRVVITGQDPYVAAYADGLAFSTNDGTVPYSLKQIHLELDREDQAKGFMPTARLSSLQGWASQGVLLLNTNLSVGDRPGSHNGWGWEYFTERVFEELNRLPTPVVFLFWGKKSADQYAHLIDTKFHHVLHAPHPAASAYRDYRGPGFVGCGHFSRTNEILKKTYGIEISW